MTTSLILNSKISSHLNRVDSRPTLDPYLLYERRQLPLCGKYRFLHYLQQGTFGRVTCAIDKVSNTKVAIKAIKKTTDDAITGARREVEIMQMIGNHPNSVQLLDYTETENYIILVLEYADSGDLYDAVHEQTRLAKLIQSDENYFISLVTQLVSVIEFAHSKGVYHRDIKPENVLLMNDGTVKLCDWGLASTNIDCYEFNLGTEKYMPPEALTKGLKKTGLSYDPSNFYCYNSKYADVWSLGVTLLYTLFGKCPFRKACPATDGNFQKFLKNKSFLLSDRFHFGSRVSP
ncbi:unnamed protein product [Ambrosiozyma monospora]|uniref:Unnamed protein product n=1 Tax=Ambrosiozyma monospora TaxID=43982 RepID=A0ACB5T7R2_AMBMO|nr:unnamed protein product [Ambrosiozyma monospora]